MRVEFDDGFFRIEQFENLLFVGFGVGVDLFARELRARRVLAGRIADHAGEVADQEDRDMAQLLKRAEFADRPCGRDECQAPLDPRRVSRAAVCRWSRTAEVSRAALPCE